MNIDPMLGCKISLNTFQRAEITRNIFSDQNGIELKINVLITLGC